MNALRSSLVFVWAMLILTILFTSCQKDELHQLNTKHQESQNSEFFKIGYIESLNSNVVNQQNEVESRSSEIIDEAYSVLVIENERSNFAEFIISEYGFPAWGSADFNLSNNQGDYFVGIPLMFANAEEISGVIVCFKTNGVFTFKLFSKFHAQELAGNYCDLSIEDKLLVLMGFHLEERTFGTSDILNFNEVECPNLFNLKAPSDIIQTRTPTTYEVCITICTAWETQNNISPDIGGMLCNLFNDLFNSCPNVSPANTVNISEGSFCSEYHTECYEVTVDVFGDIPDHDGSGGWHNKPNNGPRPNNGSNGGNNGAPIVDLSDHSRRIENCEGYFAGDPNDTGDHNNPDNVWPDAEFCDQLLCLKESLAFVWTDNDLIAWYMWYEEVYGQDTWNQVVDFTCNDRMSAPLKEEGIRLFQHKYNGTNNSWHDFEVVWKQIGEIMETGVILTQKQREWLVCHPDEVRLTLEFLNEEGNTPTTLSSCEIIIGLAVLNKLDTPPHLVELNSNAIKPIIRNALANHGLEDRLEISEESWFQIIQAQSNSPQTSFIEFFKWRLQSAKFSIQEGWNWMKEKQAQLASIVSVAQEAFPENSEEWKAFMSVMAPIMVEVGIDIGLDFIPIVGDIKGFNDAYKDYSAGNIGAAAIGVLGAVAGILPIGDMVKAGSKVVNAGITAFKAFKVIKAISRVSKSIYKKIKSLTQQGWKFKWDEAFEKIIVKNNAGDEVAEMLDDSPDLAPSFRIKKPQARDLLDMANLKNLNDVDISTPNTQSLAASIRKEPSNHIRYKVEEPEFQSRIDNIIENGDETGESTELLVREYIDQDGWEFQQGGKYGSNNGYDNVFYNPETGEGLIDECKQWAPKLTGKNLDTGLPKQMSDDWVEFVAEKIKDSDPDLAEKIRAAQANGKLIKTVSSLKRTNPNLGEIITIKVK